MPLTPADVRNKQFSTTRLRPGYDEEEVDAFLDEVEAELDRLIQENEELRAKLAECMRGDRGRATAAPPVPVPEAKPEPQPEPEPEPQPEVAREPLPQQPPSPLHPQVQPSSPLRLQPEPMSVAIPTASGEDNMDTAARVLALAQQTADQAIADARREADETLGRARREADETVGKARRQAEQIVSEARARAEALEHDAQDRHRQAMGTLVQQRDELERKVEDLRDLEREYRSRLKAYFEGQLRELEAGAADNGPVPANSGLRGMPALPPESRNGQSGAGSSPFSPSETPQPAGGFHRGSDGSSRDRR